MAYRVTSNAASLGPQGSRIAPRNGVARAHPRGGDRTQDRVLTRNAILSGVALSCLALSAAGFTLIGRDHDAGSVATYTQSHKALKIALVEPPAQAQMERVAIARATPSSAPFGPDVRVKTAKAEANPRVTPAPVAGHVKLAHVPVPKARPHKADAIVLAKVPLPRERVVEKEPEIAAPVVTAAVETNTNAADAAYPPPQPSPTRGEGEQLVASTELPSEAAPEAAETPDATIESVKTAEIAEAPVPATFGPARQMQPTMQLTAYAPPTSEQIFANDITGAIGNPFRELDVQPAPVPETTKALSRSVAPSPRPSPPRGEGEESVAAVSPKHEPAKPHDYPRPPKLSKHRAPSIQEKLWGPSVRLASLTPMDSAPKTIGPYNIPAMPYDRQTAVYVITHAKVYMPDGTVLEAHSGLGPRMDDPAYVRIRMHGATPPHVYDLKMREALFHGVEAIRMLPIGGSEAIFGRDGILAHTYMLGPSGQSNGCISFKDYDTFLDAFKAGKINRIAVLAKLD